jgi:hypothetical protein
MLVAKKSLIPSMLASFFQMRHPGLKLRLTLPAADLYWNPAG